MNILQVYNNDGTPAGLYDISETDCPDNELKNIFQNVFDGGISDEILEEEYSIIRVYIGEEITLD